MKDRDPYLDDDDEAEDPASSAELETFMETIDKKAKSFRAKIIGDAFRELGQSAKQERGKLLEAAASKFVAEATKERKASIESINAAIEANNDRFQRVQNKFEDRVEKLFGTIDLSGVTKGVESAVADAVKSLRDELADMEKARQKDYAKLTAAVEALESHAEAQFKAQTDAKAKATATPGKWRFTFGRDHLGRIDGEVVATRVTK